MTHTILLALLFIPVILPWIVRIWFHQTITIKETLVNMAVTIMLVSGVYYLSVYSEMTDVAVINGEVTGKKKVRVSCEHSYSCNCRTVKSGNTTTTQCDTCYEHINDWDWSVYSTVGTFTIDRIDRRGSDEPPRWTAAYVGEPASSRDSYVNYVKAAAHSLFNKTQVNSLVLPYPMPFDYYKMNRVIGASQLGVPVAFEKTLNHDTNLSLRKIGPTKEVNVVYIFTNSLDKSISNKISNGWFGGKKNDVVVVVSVDKEKYVNWIDVFSWSKKDIFNVELRDALNTNIKIVMTPEDASLMVGLVSTHVKKNFVRRPMEEFAYLKDDIQPSVWVIVVALLTGLFISGIMLILSHREDFFGDSYYRSRRF